ncbi:MAG: SRPBCC domain-containing protein [Acidimicrobiia bacterium]
MTDDRKLELEVEVPGTPEQVWQAIATGPGISSWYVPHVVEERTGGAATASFGDGPDMQIPGVVAAWDPPRRIVFSGHEPGMGLAFEWLVEARDGGTCVVRLVNSGFGSGEEWDAQYDAMEGGWRLFLLNLELHLTYFSGQAATSMLPMAMWTGLRDDVWPRLLNELGVTSKPVAGQRFETGADAPRLAGTVVETGPCHVSLVLDEPAPGTALIAAEGTDHCGVSVWSYLYGVDAATIVEREKPRWQQWLDDRASRQP